MYNISEGRVRHVKNRLNEIVDWQKTRAGFLQHLLTQKMGLFHHTAGKDVMSLAQAAVKYCSTLHNASTLINESAPASNNVTMRKMDWMDGWIDGWMGGWMDRWRYGWMGEWMDGWIDRLIIVFFLY